MLECKANQNNDYRYKNAFYTKIMFVIIFSSIAGVLESK